MAPATDYYAILGVSSKANEDDIRKAFRERVRACHPDRVANLDDDLKRLAEEKMVQLNEAYAVLRNSVRRAAYDERNSSIASAPAQHTAAPERSSQTPSPPPARPSSAEPVEARNKIGEQQFVARAASEEFQQQIKQCVKGGADWTPVAMGGTTLALRAAQRRNEFYFILLAAPRLDEKLLRRFLKQLDSWSSKLKPKMWGRRQVFGFAAAVEFSGQDRLRKLLEQFNGRQEKNNCLGQATLIDLVNWHVVPGETSLSSRLSTLVRGG